MAELEGELRIVDRPAVAMACPPADDERPLVEMEPGRVEEDHLAQAIPRRLAVPRQLHVHGVRDVAHQLAEIAEGIWRPEAVGAQDQLVLPIVDGVLRMPIRVSTGGA